MTNQSKLSARTLLAVYLRAVLDLIKNYDIPMKVKVKESEKFMNFSIYEQEKLTAEVKIYRDK